MVMKPSGAAQGQTWAGLTDKGYPLVRPSVVTVLIYRAVMAVFTNESLALRVVLELITSLDDADGNIIVA